METDGIDKVRDECYRFIKGEIVRRTDEGEPILPDSKYTPRLIVNDRRRRTTINAPETEIDNGRDNDEMAVFGSKHRSFRPDDFHLNRSFDSFWCRDPM